MRNIIIILTVLLCVITACQTPTSSVINQTDSNITINNEQNQSIENKSDEFIPMDFCETDADCVPANCCHPVKTVNKIYVPICNEIKCTDECKGPLDCSCGEPVCIDNTCGIKSSDNCPIDIDDHMITKIQKVNLTLKQYESCLKEYGYYFEDEPNKSFEVIYPGNVSKTAVNSFFIEELDIRYDLHLDFGSVVKYFVYPKTEDGLEVACIILYSNPSGGISLFGGGGSGANNDTQDMKLTNETNPLLVVNMTENDYLDCKQRYSYYFNENPYKQFEVIFSNSIPISEVDNYLHSEIKAEYYLRLETKYTNKCIVIPKIYEGIKTYCMIQYTVNGGSPTLIGPGGSGS